MEHTAFASGEKLMLLHFLAVKYFGHDGGLVGPAPPRHRLRIFGGDLNIEDFRTEHHFLTKTLSPPLISTPEVYERSTINPSGDVRISGSKLITEASHPQTPASSACGSSASLFSNFVRQKRSASSSGISADKALHEQSIPGTLSVFMKKMR